MAEKDISCAHLEQPVLFEGRARDRSMELHLYSSAREAVGEITPGCEKFGFTKGQFSLTDIVCEIASQIGPCDLTISTWTAARADIGHCYRFVEEGYFRSVRWIIDRSFKSRQPEYLNALIGKFGLEAVRVTRTHAKFCLLRNDDFDIVLRSSMNLNRNPRFENYEISDDADFADFFASIVDEIFESQDVGRFLMDSEQYEAQFRNFKGGQAKKSSGSELPQLF